jgi:hypothetical protein
MGLRHSLFKEGALPVDYLGNIGSSSSVHFLKSSDLPDDDGLVYGPR